MSEYMKIVRALLRTVRLAWCLSSALTGVVRVAGIVCGVVLLTLILDAALVLPTSLRWACLGIWVLVTIAATFRLLLTSLPLFASEERLAAHLEQSVPEIDNALINTVQLVTAEGPNPESWMVQQYVIESAGRLRGFSGWRAFERSGIWAAAKRTAWPIVCLALCVAFFPSVVSSGLYRVVHPASTMNAAFGMRIDVTPGDMTIAEGSDLEIVAAIQGPVPEEVVVEYEEPDAEEPVRLAMSPGDQTYKAIMRNIVAPCSYCVVATPAKTGRSFFGLRSGARRTAVSKTYQIMTVPPPKLERVRIECVFPDYLGRAPEVQEPATGDLKVPVGTQVSMQGEANKPLSSAALTFGEESLAAQVNGNVFSLVLTVDKSLSYQFKLQDEQGFTNVNAVYHSITAIADRAPAITITSPEADVAVAPADTVPIVFRADDDYGLVKVELCVTRGQQTEPTVVQSYLADAPPTREFQQAAEVQLKGMDLQPGDVVQAWIRAVDNVPEKPNEARSRTVNIRIAGGEPDATESEASRDILERVAALLAKQQEMNKNLDMPLKRVLASEDGAALYRDRFNEGVGRQEGIREETIAIAADASSLHSGEVARVLTALAANEMPAVVDDLRNLGGPGSQAGSKFATDALKGLTTIVAKLEDLLRRLDAEPQGEQAGMKLEEPEQKLEQGDVRKQIEETLTEFTHTQSEIIEQSNNLSPKPVDDLTAEEKDAFRAAAVAEDDLSKFLEELVSDLSKLPEQDFSAPSLKDELVEILAEVELAEDALEMRNKTIAVTEEETGLELAKELVNDLPRWLSDVPDKLKWEMEEPSKEYDVPMAELPDELYDMMGDLIDQESAMTEEVEDESSSWADSIDAGAGWMAMDGPMSNMSAKGITGNLLPNSSEIGGRSGEGRTGRAHGEFVEKTAQGKGGRDTPTRISPDAYEQGVVEDTNAEPIGGATGGGKLSGAGGSGLPGPPPPEVQNTMKRLAGQQADIRVKAERLQFKLNVVNIPAPGLDAAIGTMREIEEDLRSYRYQDVLPKKEIVLNTMRESHETLQQQIKIRGEQRVYLPKQNQLEILEALDEEVVPEYRDMVADYFRTLSQAR